MQEVCIHLQILQMVIVLLTISIFGGLGSKTTSNFGHNSYSSDHVDAIRNDDIIFGELA